MVDYHIKQGDSLILLKTMGENSVDSIVCDPPYELGFMGKKWDSSGIAYNIDLWKECLRVLKPGGHLLAFGGTRTYHRMTCAIEDAGFEIRDCIIYCYGSGFPKSLNVGKKIDEIQGNEREVIKIDKRYNEPSGIVNIGQGERTLINRKVTKGTSEWEGWGTALKPALEPIVMARKPLSEKNIALNVLKWGTGGINIDGCRIPTVENLNGGAYSGGERCEGDWKDKSGFKNNNLSSFQQPLGRFPANLIHDGSEEVVNLFPNTKPSKRNLMKGGKKETLCYGNYNEIETERGHNDNGGSASRFFYCAKTSKSERNAGLEGFTNTHPTLKPLKLLKYLCRLVTPKNGIVLDPFMGSGSTGCACMLENFHFVGIELTEEYIPIAKARIEHYKKKSL